MKLTILNIPWWWTDPIQHRAQLLGHAYSSASSIV